MSRTATRSAAHAAMICAALAVTLAGCASTPKTARPETVSSGDEVFGLVGPDTPRLLVSVRQSPYATPDPTSCTEIERQIAELDGLLGPDVDQSGAGESDQVGEWAKGAIRGLIPYRSVVRFLTGASRKEREKAQAMLAGAVRRGFLKGVHRTLPCPTPASTAAAAPPAG